MKNNKIIAFLTKSLPETKATLELEKKENFLKLFLSLSDLF